MNQKGFAITGILYTLLLLAIVSLNLLLYNLLNRKNLLDQMKMDTVNAVECDINFNYLLDQINELKSKIGSETLNSVGDGTIVGEINAINDLFEMNYTYNSNLDMLANNQKNVYTYTASEDTLIHINSILTARASENILMMYGYIFDSTGKVKYAVNGNRVQNVSGYWTLQISGMYKLNKGDKYIIQILSSVQPEEASISIFSNKVNEIDL